MPNDIVRSVSDFFNRSKRERKSDRRNRNATHVSETFVRSPVVRQKTHRPPVEFNDDYVDPVDMINRTEAIGRYDEPWETSSASVPNKNTYDSPWGQKNHHPRAKSDTGRINYDEPWDAIGSTNGTISSETGKTSSSSGSSRTRSVKNADEQFRPDPRLVIDPFSNPANQPANSSAARSRLIHPPDNPHRRSRSLVPPPPQNPNGQSTAPAITHPKLEPTVRPAKSYESIPQTPGILESPLKWQERTRGTNDISESQYLKQMLRQTPALEAEDLLYKPYRAANVYDSPWAARPVVTETIPVNHSLYKLYDLNNSMSSQSTQSSSDHQCHNRSVLLLDQMDYYRAGMTRHEAEKILSGEPVGVFVVRRNTQNPAWFSLSVVTAEQGVLHLVISEDAQRGWHIGGFSPFGADFSSIPELINHYHHHNLNIKGTKGLLLQQQQHHHQHHSTKR